LRTPTRSNDPKATTGSLGQQPPRDLRPIRRLIPFVIKYPWRLGLTVGFLLISAISSLIIPSLAGQIIDKGFVERNLDKVGEYGLIAIAVALIMALASAGRFYFISILGERVLTDLRRKVFEHLLTLDSRFFDLHRVGELTSRLNGDVATIRGAIGSSLSIMLRAVVMLTGAVVLMFLTSPYLALTIVIIGPAILIPRRWRPRRWAPARPSRASSRNLSNPVSTARGRKSPSRPRSAASAPAPRSSAACCSFQPPRS
jgi:ATP-binding cassette subfamily B protein